MALFRKANNTAWQSISGWLNAAGTPATVIPGANDTRKIDSAAGSPGSLSGISSNPAGVWVAADTQQTSWTVVPTATDRELRFSDSSVDSSVPTPGSRSYRAYIANGRTFLYQGNIFLVDFTNNIYTEENAVFGQTYALSTTPTLLVGLGTSADKVINKYGPGTFRPNPAAGTTGTGLSFLSAVNIYEGIVEVTGGGTAASRPLGVNQFTMGYAGNLTPPSLNFVNAAGLGSTRQIANSSLNVAGAATIDTASGFTATMQCPASGGGTLTIAGAGTLNWNNNISCPLNVTGLLTMAESRNLSGTLSGIGGTIAMSGGTISGDAPTFTGDVTGAFTYNASGGKTFGGNAQGTVTVTGGTLTATASNSGTIANISGGAGVTLSSNGTFTGDLTGYTYLGQLPTAGVATFSMVGSTATFARNLSLTNGSNVRLSNSATLASPIVVTNITSNTSSMTVEDATTNTFTGSYISDGSAGSDNVSVKTGGTLVVSGSIDGRRSDRVWNLNNADGYAGTIRITGVGFYNSLGNAPTAAPAFLKRGKIQFARAGVSYLAGGLTVESGSTIACAASNAAYAAQLSGNLTLSAGSFMKFGTA